MEIVWFNRNKLKIFAISLSQMAQVIDNIRFITGSPKLMHWHKQRTNELKHRDLHEFSMNGLGRNSLDSLPYPSDTYPVGSSSVAIKLALQRPD